MPTAVPTVVLSRAPTGQRTDISPTFSSNDDSVDDGGLSTAAMGAAISIPVAALLLRIVYGLNIMFNGITNAATVTSSGGKAAVSTESESSNSNNAAAAGTGLEMTSNEQDDYR